MKTYSRHYCERQHRSYRTVAKCLWPRAHWIAGSGPYATVAYCRALTVELWPDRDAAELAMRTMAVTGCGGACGKRHDLIRLRFDHLEVPR